MCCLAGVLCWLRNTDLKGDVARLPGSSGSQAPPQSTQEVWGAVGGKWVPRMGEGPSWEEGLCGAPGGLSLCL